jgi:hypothetical protein
VGPFALCYNRFMPSRTLILIAATLAATSSLAATQPPKLDRYRAFVDSCTRAFDQSSDNGSGGVGHQICECTAKESKHEGVTADALERETAAIRKDHKHQITDQKLLNALHYCSIQVLHET